MNAVSNLLNQQVQTGVDMERLIEDVKKMPKVLSYQENVGQRHANISMKRKNMELKMERLLVEGMGRSMQGRIFVREADYGPVSVWAAGKAAGTGQPLSGVYDCRAIRPVPSGASISAVVSPAVPAMRTDGSRIWENNIRTLNIYGRPEYLSAFRML